MIDSPHAQPRNLQEVILENNAMLNTLLQNQAAMMEMLCQVYQFGYHSEMGQWPSPSHTDKDNIGRAQIADANFERYKETTAQLFSKLKSQLQTYA